MKVASLYVNSSATGEVNSSFQTVQNELELVPRGVITDRVVSAAVAGDAIVVPHTLGEIPDGFIQMNVENLMTIYANQTDQNRWTDEVIVVRANVASTGFRLLVLKQE